eukprot:Awhi_evm1s4271
MHLGDIQVSNAGTVLSKCACSLEDFFDGEFYDIVEHKVKLDDSSDSGYDNDNDDQNFDDNGGENENDDDDNDDDDDDDDDNDDNDNDDGDDEDSYNNDANDGYTGSCLSGSTCEDLDAFPEFRLINGDTFCCKIRIKVGHIPNNGYHRQSKRGLQEQSKNCECFEDHADESHVGHDDNDDDTPGGHENLDNFDTQYNNYDHALDEEGDVEGDAEDESDDDDGDDDDNDFEDNSGEDTLESHMEVMAPPSQ